MNDQVSAGAQDRFLRLPDVMELTGLKRASVYKAIDKDGFPRPVRLSLRSSAWSENEVQRWIAERKRKRAGMAP